MNILCRSFKEYYYVILLIGVLTLLPFFLLSQYNNPSQDDYYLAVRDANNSFLATQADVYLHWSGRYFATAVARINPLLYDSFTAYKIYSFSVLLLLIITTLLLFDALLSIYVGRIKASALAFLVLAVFLVQMPDVAQGIFWFSGYMTYLFPTILTILFLFFLLRLNAAASAPARIVVTIVLILLAFAIIGSNEMSLIILLSTLLFILIITWHLKAKLAVQPYLVFIFYIGLIFGLAVIFAPGSYSRMGSQSGHSNLILSAVGALALVIAAFFKWSSVLLLATLIYIPLWGIPLSIRIKNSLIFKSNLLLLAIWFISTIWLMHFIHVYSTGDRAGTRVENVIYFFFVIGWFYIVQVIISRYWHLLRLNMSAERTKFFSSLHLLLFLLMLFQLESNITTAYLDLFSGNANTFDKELDARYNYLSSATCSKCLIQPISILPKSLYIWNMLPVEEAGELGITKEFALFWNKESIKLNASASSPPENLEVLKNLGKKIKWQLEN